MEQGDSREAKDLIGEPQPDLKPELLAAWRAAEDRLYPMVMVVPENYERVVRLVGATTVELQLACSDLASLVDEAPRVADRVRRLATEAGMGDALEFELIASAACLLRYRQIQSQTHRQQRIRLIEEASATGKTWVTLEQGSAPTSWPPLPSTTVEMHLPTGRALELTTSMDESTGAARFRITEVSLDPGSGEPGPGPVTEEAYADLHEWQAAIAARRLEIESGH
jgi:hypothetical protein